MAKQKANTSYTGKIFTNIKPYIIIIVIIVAETKQMDAKWFQ